MSNLRSKLHWMVCAGWLVAPVYGGDGIATGGGSTGADSEFGVVEEITYRKSNWEPWRISLGGDVHYLDNIRFIDNLAPELSDFLTDEDDFIFRTGVSVEYTPLITDNLFFDATVSQEFYRFDKLDQLDFDYFSGDLGFIYVIQALRDLQVFARYRYENLGAATFDGEIYSNHSVEFGAQQVYRFAPGQSVFGAVKSQISLDASPDISQFDEYSLNLGYQWESDPFEVMFLYRFAYLPFDGIDRTDYSHIVMLRGEYHWRDWLSFAADVSFNSNVSDLDAFDYNSFGVGVGLSLQMTF